MCEPWRGNLRMLEVPILRCAFCEVDTSWKPCSSMVAATQQQDLFYPSVVLRVGKFFASTGPGHHCSPCRLAVWPHGLASRTRSRRPALDESAASGSQRITETPEKACRRSACDLCYGISDDVPMVIGSSAPNQRLFMAKEVAVAVVVYWPSSSASSS